MINGIDLSSWNTVTDWKQVASWAQFVILKGAENGIPDKCLSWAPDVRKNGMALGIYIFAHPFRDNPYKLAQQAWDLERKYECTIPSALDLESPEPKVFIGQPHNQKFVSSFILNYIEAYYKLSVQNPIIYTGKYWWKAIGDPTIASCCPLWCAQYSQTITRPGGFGGWKECDIHQYRGNVFKNTEGKIIVPGGRCPGVVGDVDLNTFYGTIDELNFIGQRHL